MKSSGVVQLGEVGGTWQLVHGLFVFRAELSFRAPVGLATSYWTFKVDDLGPRIVTRIRWLKAYADDRADVAALLARPPETSIEAALFHRKVAIRLEDALTLQIETEGDAEAERACVPLARWLLDRALALREREKRGGLELGEAQAIEPYDEHRAIEVLTLQDRGYRYRVSFESRLGAELELKKSAGEAKLEIAGGADHADAARALRGVELPPALARVAIDGRLFQNGRGFLEAVAPDLYVPTARAFVKDLLRACAEHSLVRNKDAARRLRGEVDADALELLRQALELSTATCAGWAARTAEDRLEVKLQLHAPAAEGVLRVTALDVDAERVQLSLEVDLPDGPRAKLNATQGGLIAWISNQLDDDTGHDELDARFLIEAEGPGLAELKALAPAWLRAAPLDARVEPVALKAERTLPRDDAAAAAEAMLDLWRALAVHRAGGEVDGDG